tara:strand:+ start:351 stop:542 length:192 start_codon:yes stop_codon:yes gene_type:complete
MNEIEECMTSRHILRIQMNKASIELDTEIAELRGAKAVLKLNGESSTWNVDRFFRECRVERLA